MKLSCLVDIVDQNNVTHELLVVNILNIATPESFKFTNHAVKHKKL